MSEKTVSQTKQISFSGVVGVQSVLCSTFVTKMREEK
jgi:hypothetical protein